MLFENTLKMTDTIKIVLTGIGGVGKSALTITFVSNVWVPEYDPTIEDSHRKQVLIDEQASMLDILDTAGQEEYSSMQDQWFRAGQGFIIVYSIINKKSWLEVDNLRQKIHRIKDCTDIPIVICGNKVDLEEDRQVPKEEVIAKCEGYGHPFFETSAKNHLNVDESFTALVRAIRVYEQGKSEKKPCAGSTTAPSTPKPKKKSPCEIL